MSNSLWPHELQHARPPCPSPTPGVHSNSSQWCHPAISSSVVPSSFCPQPLPESESFPMSQLFPSDDQSIGVSASTSVLPVSVQGWFPLGLTGLISLLSKGLSGVNLISFLLYFWRHWVLVAAHGRSLWRRAGATLWLRCMDFLPQWLLLLRSTGSRVCRLL